MTNPRTKSTAARFSSEALDLLRTGLDLVTLLEDLLPSGRGSGSALDPTADLKCARSDLSSAVRALSRLRAWAEYSDAPEAPSASGGLVRHEDRAVCPHVRELQSELAKRALHGLNTYGTTIDESPRSLPQWLQEAKEEALDLAVYLQKAIRLVEDGLRDRPNHPEPDR